MHRFLFFLCFHATLFALITDSISLCVLRVSFLEDTTSSTTGNGRFLLTDQGIDCGQYTIDPPPHDYDYFLSQIDAVNKYFQHVSYGKFGIDIEHSSIFPSSLHGDYGLSNTMGYYNPYGNPSIKEERLTRLFKDTIEKSYETDSIKFSDYDLVVIFHAGIGQDFSLPFLDPTPEDIPSTFIDSEMIQKYLGHPHVTVGDHFINKGIILPETQNHLLYDISESMFSDAERPCEYQYGLTGTFSLMIGFAIGLPPLWNIETGESGVGIFGLMDQGSNNGRGIVPAPPTAWTRLYAGWENYVIGEFGLEYSLPIRSENSIIKIPIRSDEYYLVESRSNWIKPNVSIDSLRFEIGSNEYSDTYPSYIEILIDSSGIARDSNGVFNFVPNYDIGLPESGMLIWHIDESVIYNGISSYGINSDLNIRGVDLEEADGAQDIGFISFDIFNDPTSGWFGDIWYKGNSQYILANPNMNGLKPTFGPETFPSTKANDNSHTFIAISDISKAKDTMNFILTNSYIANSFPDTLHNFKISTDINNDGRNDILGGKDSLYVQLISDNLTKQYFHYPEALNFDLFVKNYENNSDIHVFEFFPKEVKHYIYNYDIVSDSINFMSLLVLDSLMIPIINEGSIEFVWKNTTEWDLHKKRVIASPRNYYISDDGRGIQVDKFGEFFSKWNSRSFCYIAGIDIDMDANIDLIALDTNGILYLFNHELNLMPSFPLDVKLAPPILSQNLLDDNFPEIIGKSKDREQLYVFDSQGQEIFNITTLAQDSLISLGEFGGRSSIFTQSAIYQFDLYIDPLGNSWSTEHGGMGNSRIIDLNYSFSKNGKELLRNTYCYPNPIAEGLGTIRIETFGSENINADVYDLTGHFIQSFNKQTIYDGLQINEFRWDTSDISPGLYFVHVSAVKGNENETIVLKIAVVE